MLDVLGNYRTLVLNADFSPTSFHPLETLSSKKAIKGVFKDRYYVAAEYPVALLCPGSARREPFSMNIPAVVVLKAFRRVDRVAAFTRANVFLRDRYRCAYCKHPEQLGTRELTFDHVVPRSKGGKTSWENIVSCCAEHNAHKGNRTVKAAKMTLYRPAWSPTQAALVGIGRDFPPQVEGIPATWAFFLGLETPVEEACNVGIQGSAEVFPAGMSSLAYWGTELQQD